MKTKVLTSIERHRGISQMEDTFLHLMHSYLKLLINELKIGFHF